MKYLKKRLKNGETLLGCWLNLGSSLTAEITALAGFDWVLVDLEHGAGTENNLLCQLQAIQHTPAAPIVRIESYERQRIHRVLDLGAEGVMCPRVATVAEAEKFARGLRYPPAGTRGVAKMVRASGFGVNFPAYLEQEQEEIIGILQVETLEALDHLDQIAALDGIDVLFIGPADLSIALGVFGRFDHPLFVDAVKKTIKSAQKYGKAAGILLFNPDDFPIYHEMGIRLFASGSDAVFAAEGARTTFTKLSNFRNGITNHTS